MRNGSERRHGGAQYLRCNLLALCIGLAAQGALVDVPVVLFYHQVCRDKPHHFGDIDLHLIKVISACWTHRVIYLVFDSNPFKCSGVDSSFPSPAMWLWRV